MDMNDCSACSSPLEKAWPEFPAGGGPAASTELANVHSPWCGSLVACPGSLSLFSCSCFFWVQLWDLLWPQWLVVSHEGQLNLLHNPLRTSLKLERFFAEAGELTQWLRTLAALSEDQVRSDHCSPLWSQGTCTDSNLIHTSLEVPEYVKHTVILLK